MKRTATGANDLWRFAKINRVANVMRPYIMERVRVRRESILRRRGLLDSTAILRDVREHGA